jgi:hypothetical protein
MYEKVIERLLWNTAQREYSTYGGGGEACGNTGGPLRGSDGRKR